VQEKLFSLVKEKAVDALRNVALARPDEHACRHLTLLLTENQWIWTDELRRLEALERNDLEVFHRQVRRVGVGARAGPSCVDLSVFSGLCSALQVMLSLSLRLGVLGNMSESCALGLGEEMESLLHRNPRFSPLPPSLQPVTRFTQVESGGEEEPANFSGFHLLSCTDRCVFFVMPRCAAVKRR
jgi:hypothetical protein